MRYHLGKRPARPDAIKLRFGSYYKAAELPPPPLVIGNFTKFPTTWGMLGNDEAGDCVIASADHGEMLARAIVGLPAVTFSNFTAFADYSACLVDQGGAPYTPSDPSTDTGLDLQMAAAFRQKVGITDLTGGKHKIGVYAGLSAGNLNELAQAVYLFGVADVGVNLPASAEQQFDAAEPFTVVPGSNSVGGHCMCCVGRNSAGNYLMVTWGRLQAVTPLWLATYMDEGVVYIPTELANDALLADFKEVTNG